MFFFHYTGQFYLIYLELSYIGFECTPKVFFRILLDKTPRVPQYFRDVFGKLFSLADSKKFRYYCCLVNSVANSREFLIHFRKTRSSKGSNYVQERCLAAIFRPKTFQTIHFLAKSANI